MKHNLHIHPSQWITSLFGGQQELVWWVNRPFSLVALVFPIQIMWRYLRALSLCRVHQKDCVRAWKCRPTLEKNTLSGIVTWSLLGKQNRQAEKAPLLVKFSWIFRDVTAFNFSDLICMSISKIFNCSLTRGVFPDDWKSAKVTPLFKQGSSSDMNNYRPIHRQPRRTVSEIMAARELLS